MFVLDTTAIDTRGLGEWAAGMTKDHRYFTYMMASLNRTLYIGVTGSLKRRVMDHKSSRVPGFTKTYGCDRLVWFAQFEYVNNAIATEKKLKGWLRAKKIALVEEKNPRWDDLSAEWFTEEQILRWREVGPSLRSG